MGCCYPKPTPHLGDKHTWDEGGKGASIKNKHLLARQKTCFDLDKSDRGTQISVFVGQTHKVQLNVPGDDTLTVRQIINKVEEVLTQQSDEVWPGECHIDNLMHRHQLPLYQVFKMKQVKPTVTHDDLQGQTVEAKVEPLAHDMQFKDIPDIVTHALVGALESVHFLALTEQFNVDTYAKMEEDPDIRFVDHMGMEVDRMYWLKEGRHIVEITEALQQI